MFSFYPILQSFKFVISIVWHLSYVMDLERVFDILCGNTYISSSQFFLLDSGLFLTFPKESRRILAKEVVEQLLNDPESNAKLNHEMHVRVVMENVGQAFGLDVEDAHIISRVTDLYRKWLFDGDRRPLAVIQQEQDIAIVLFSSLSSNSTFKNNPNDLTIHFEFHFPNILIIHFSNIFIDS
jgi:hypothetical protein